MWKLTFELLSYSSFICVLYIISYLNHSLDEYYQVKHLRRFLLNPQSSTLDFSKVRIGRMFYFILIVSLKIKTINEYWRWLEESFVKNIIAENWYNGQPDNETYAFLNDRSNRLMGWATMRQLRIKPGLFSSSYEEKHR